MDRPVVLVLGAAGRLGRAAAQAFADARWQVRAQARRADAALPSGAQRVGAALADTPALLEAARGARAVVYAVNPPYTQWDALMLPLARQGMAVAERLGALFMLPGNVYGFGAGMPALLREDTPERPSTRKGELRVALEAELRERAQQGTLRSVVLRAGDFYGGGRGSWLDLAIVKSLAAGKLVYPGPLDRPHAWAYLPDLARAFVAVAGAAHEGGQPGQLGQLGQPGPPGHRRLHFAGHTLSGRELLDAIEAAAAALGLRPARGFRRADLPWPLLRAAGLVVPMLREIAAMSYLWRVPHALDGSALAAAVGPLPSTPVAEAMRDALLGLGLGRPAADPPASPAP